MILVKPIRKTYTQDDLLFENWCGMKRRQRQIKYDQLIDRIVYATSATRGDVELVISSLITQMEEGLLEGCSVQVGRLGSFDLSVITPIVENPDDLRAQQCRIGKIYFRPGTLLRQSVRSKAYFQVDRKRPKEKG